eukprot:1160545-Pelagomonas_calceolata.AAC.4
MSDLPPVSPSVLGLCVLATQNTSHPSIHVRAGVYFFGMPGAHVLDSHLPGHPGLCFPEGAQETLTVQH